MKKGSKMTKAQRAAHSKRLKAAFRKKRLAAERERAATQHVGVVLRRPNGTTREMVMRRPDAERLLLTRERKPSDPVADCLAALVAAVQKRERERLIAKLNEGGSE